MSLEENVEDFTIQPPNSNESNDDNQENEQQDSLKQDDWRIVANEGSSGKSVNITLGYKKKVTIENTEPEQGGSDENTSDEPVVTNESTDGTEEEIPSYVEKILKIKITSVTEYPVIDENQENTNSGENEDTSGDTDVQPENPSVPDVDDSTNPGESTPDGSDDETENETPKPIELDIIIKRQTGVDKVYIENGDVHQSDTYSYEISITNPDEKPERTHWEYN